MSQIAGMNEKEALRPEYPERVFRLSPDDRQTLSHALIIAAERFESNSIELNRTEEHPDIGMDSLKRLAKQMDEQAADCRRIQIAIEKFDAVGVYLAE